MNKNDVTVNYAFQEYIPEKELNERGIKEVSRILTYEESRWTLKDTASALKIIKEADSSLYETIQSYIKEQHLPSENVLYLDFGKSLRYDREYMGDFSKETLSDKLDNRFIVRYSHDNDEGNLIDGGDEIIINDENIVSLFNSMIEEHVKENIQKYDEYKIEREASQKNEVWTWKDYDDLSGHLESPDGKSYFEYDWTTKEYKITSDSGWDSFIDADPTRDTSLTAFKEYAQKFVKENIVRDSDIKIILEREFIDTEKLLEEEEKRMAKSETLADKYNRMEKLFEGKMSHLGSGNGETFNELCKWVEEEFPEKDSEGVLLEATSRMLEEMFDFDEFNYQNYDDVYGFGNGAQWRFDLSDSAAKKLLSGEILNYYEAQNYIWEKTKKEFAELKNNPQYKDEIEITDRINSAFRIADYLCPEFTKEIDKEKNILPDEWPQYSKEEKKNVINNAFEHLDAAFKENRVILYVDEYDEDRLIIVDKTIPLKHFETLIKGRDAVNFGKESLSFTCPNAEQLQTGIKNGWGLKEILTGYDVFQELDRFNETGQMLAELEAEKEFVPSEYVMSKLKEKGIEVVTDKKEFNELINTSKILQKMKSDEKENISDKYFQANKSEAEAFAKELDVFVASVNSSEKPINPLKMLNVGSISPVMKVLGIADVPVQIEQSTVSKALREEPLYPNDKQGHKLTLDEIKTIPQSLADPVMVFRSDSPTRRQRDSYVFFTEHRDFKGRSVIIPVAVNKKFGRIVINKINSIYGRNEEVGYVKDNIKRGNLVYFDKKRSLEWERECKVQFLAQVLPAEGSINNILSKDSLVKFLESKTQNMVHNGTTYGFAHNGKIYLNPDVLSSEVAMHEYTHLWDNLTKKDNPELWNKGLQIFKDTSLWNEVVNDENYADIKDDENLVLSECHARITGKVAEAVLNRIAEQDGTEKQAEMVDWDKETINFIFENYRDVFAKNGFETVAEFTSATMKDLFIPVEQQKRDISNSSAYERMEKLFEGKNADYFGNSSSNDFKEIYHFLKNEFPLKDALHETVSCMIYSNINFGALEPANYDVVYDKEGVDERYNITGEIAKMLINNEIPSDWMAIQNEVNDFASRRLMDLKENNPDMLVTDSINEAFEISKKYNPLEEKILTVYTKSEKIQNIQKALENIEKTYTEDSHDIRIDYGTGIFGADLEALIKGNDAAIYGEKFLDFVRPDRVSLELGIEDNIPFKDLIRGYGDNFFSESEGVKVPVHIERWEYMEVFDSDYDAAQQWCRETGGKLLENGKDIWISDEKLEHYCYPDTPENRKILKEYLLPQPLEFNWDNFTEEQFNAVKEEITSGKIKEDYKGQVYVGSVCAEFTITDKESNWVDYNNYILGEKGEGEISGIPYSYKFGKQVGMDTFIENTYEDFKTVIKNVLMQDFGKDSHLKQEAMRQTINWATINENNKDAAIALWNEKMGLTITHSITFPCGFTFPKEVYENDLGENKREEYRWKIYEKIKNKYGFNDNDAETEYFPGATPSDSSFNISFSVSVPEEIKINLEKVNKWIEGVENYVKEECGCTFINWQGGERNEQTFVNEKQFKMQQERNSDFAHPNAEDLDYASPKDIKEYCKLNSEIELTDEQVREIHNFYDNNDQFALYVSPAGNLYERDEYKEELISADSELLKAGNHLRTLEGKERLDYLLKNSSVDKPEWSTGLLNQLSNNSDERFKIVSDVLSDSFATLDRHDNFWKVLLEYGADPTRAIRIAAEDANLGDNLNWFLDNVPESQLNQIFSDNGYADAVFDIAQKSVEHDMDSWHSRQDIGFEGFKRIARLCEREADADHYYGKLLEKAFEKPVEPKIMQLLDTPELLAEKMNAQHIHQNEPEITKEQASAILDYCNYENIKFYCDKNGDIFSLDVSEDYNGEGLKEDNFGIAANGIEYARKAKELNYSCYSTATFNMVSELWQKERQFVNPSVENITNAKEKVLNKPTLSFIDDEEKMRDFATISKEEFLSSYSYLSEKEYEATAKEYNELNQSAVQSNVSNTVKTVEDVNKVYDRNLDFIEQNISFKESNPEYNEIDEIQKWKNGELFIPVADGNGNFTNDMEANTLDDYNIYSDKNFGSYSEIIKYQADLKAELLDTAIENNIKEYLRREYAETYPYSGKFEVTVENQSYPIDKDGLDYIANSDEWGSVEDRLNDVIDRRFEEEIEQKENDILSDVKEYIAQETNGNLILKDSELREVLFSEELVQIYAPKEDFLANQPEEVKAALVEAGIARSELYNNVESIPVSEEARNAMLSASYVGQGGITQKAFADNGIEIDLATANALENCFLQIEAMTKYTADGHDLFHSGNGVDTISEHTIEYSEANKAWFVHEKNWLALSAIKGNEAEPDDYMEKAGRVGDRNWALSCKELVKYVYQEIKVDGEMEKEFPDTFKKLEKLNAYLEAPERIKENGFQRRKEDYFANIKVSTENFRDVFNEVIKLPKFKDKPLEAASWCFSKVPKENKAEVAQWFSNLGCKTKKDTNKLFNKWNRENNPKLNVNKSKNNDKDDWSISD